MKAPVKTKFAAVKLTPDQDRAVEQRAQRCKMSKAAWMRSILVQAATRDPVNGFLRIREPDGVTN